MNLPPHYCFRTLTHIFQQLMWSTQNEKTELLTQKNRLKRQLFKVFWSECGDSNPGPPAPKPMSKPSGSPVAPSLALSGTPSVPLWNSFALFVSGTTFVFWDLCGMKFCILKVLPTGFTPSSDGSIAENNSEIAPHKQRNKRDDKETAG